MRTPKKNIKISNTKNKGRVEHKSKKGFVMDCRTRNTITLSKDLVSLITKLKNNPNTHVYWSGIAYDEVMLRIERFIASDHQRTVEVRCPSSWWQMLKRDCFPFLTRVFPVKTKVIERIAAKIYYPNIVIPNEKAYVKFEMLGGLEGEYE